MDCNIASPIFALIGAALGFIGSTFLNYHFVKKSTELNVFNIAITKFRNEIMSFYNEICEMCFENPPVNYTWTYTTMKRIMPIHRKLLNELTLAIPIKHRHRFNVIADNYCPPDESYIKDKAGSKYWSDDIEEREIAFRKDIKNNLDRILEFTI